MDEPYHLIIELHGAKFDATGPVEIVNQWYQDFLKALATRPAQQNPQTQNSPTEPSIPDTIPIQQRDVPIDGTELSKIMNVKERIVSLTVRAQSVEDAVMLIILGQRVLRNNELTTGGEIIDGLSHTGGVNIGRVDRLLEKIARDGNLIVTGARRSKRYRLTNSGLAKARDIAGAALATIA